MRPLFLGLGLVAASGGAAEAARLDLFGELRGAGLAILGSPVQFGGGGPNGRCGEAPPADGGAYFAGTGLLSVTAPAYSYRLALSAGYYAIACTDSLRRPLGGLDYRGRHRFGERTQLRSGLRGNFDVFDRTLDIRLGTFDPSQQELAPPPAAGTVYLTANAYVELERWLDRRHALRATASLQTMQIFTDIRRLAEYTTLGPMTAAELQLDGVRAEQRDVVQLSLRYRVSHYYPVTLALDHPQGEVPPAHDGSVRAQYERRLSPLLTLRGDLGVALARQDQLCVAGPALQAQNSCSIDWSAPGVRGAANAPAAEFALGRRTTGTFVGEVGLRYQSQRHSIEATLSRGYEPNAYAAALDLANRLSATAQLRPFPALLLTGSALIGHHGHTSPGRLSSVNPDDLEAPRVSPQNRTMIMTQGSLGADWTLRRSVAVFGQLDAQVFAIRGEEVQARDQGGAPRPDMDGQVPQVAGFPQGGDAFQTVWRLSFLVGVRVFTEPPRREPGLLQSVRTIQ